MNNSFATDFMSYLNDRIFMIGWEYPPLNSGGLGVACQGLTQSLSEANTQIFFTLPYTYSGPVDHMKILECIHASWSGPTTEAPFQAYDQTRSHTGKQKDFSGLDARALAALPQSDLEFKVNQYADVVAQKAQRYKNDFDVIHAHDWMSFPAGIKVKQQTGKPLIAHIHSTELDRIPSGAGSPYILHVEKAGMDEADLIVTVSNYTKYVLIYKYGIPEEKIVVVHNGMSEQTSLIRPGRHHFAQKRPVIVFMGRLTDQKGPQYFLTLAKSVLKKLPTALFIMAGSGDLYHQLLLTTAKEGLSASFLFSGFLRDQQRETLLDRADVFVMPSLSEPFGLVALEAAQRFTPVIVSQNSGVKEVMPHALVADFWDLEKMTSMICKLVKRREIRNHIVKAQLKEVSKISWGAAAHKVKHIYHKLLHKTV